MLEHKGKAVVGDGPKAEAFAQHYAAVSRHSFTKEERGRAREVKQALSADRKARLAGRVNDEGNTLRGRTLSGVSWSGLCVNRRNRGLLGRMGLLPSSSISWGMQLRSGS